MIINKIVDEMQAALTNINNLDLFHPYAFSNNSMKIFKREINYFSQKTVDLFEILNSIRILGINGENQFKLHKRII